MVSIETDGLTKRYDDLVAVDDLTLSVEPGEVLGFLGPNGAGKSTTIKMLVGLVSPTGGRAWIDGHDVERDGVAARESVGYLPEVVGLYEELTAQAYLRYVGRFRSITGSRATHRIEQLLAEVRLSHAADREIGTFSKGMRQRLALAGALMHDPDVLILDEPLTGLDPEGIVKMKRAITHLGGERAVFLSSHELHAVESLCDRAVILRDGVVQADRSVDELTRREPPTYTVRTAQPVDPSTLDGVDGLLSAARGADEHELVLEVEDPDAAARALERLVETGVAVRSFAPDRTTLEEAFIDVTGVRA